MDFYGSANAASDDQIVLFYGESGGMGWGLERKVQVQHDAERARKFPSDLKSSDPSPHTLPIVFGMFAGLL